MNQVQFEKLAKNVSNKTNGMLLVVTNKDGILASFSGSNYQITQMFMGLGDLLRKEVIGEFKPKKKTKKK